MMSCPICKFDIKIGHACLHKASLGFDIEYLRPPASGPQTLVFEIDGHLLKIFTGFIAPERIAYLMIL